MYKEGKIILFCGLSGGGLGLIACITIWTKATNFYTFRFNSGELWITAVVAVLIGVFIGTVCSWLVAFLTRRKELRRVLVTNCVVTPLVTAACAWTLGDLTVSLSKLGALVAASAIGFVITNAVLWWILPDVYEAVGACTACGYDLRGSLPEARCPECGRRFDAGRVRSELAAAESAPSPTRHT